MTYDPKIHHRRSIRLKGYDYSRAGLYFITVCSQDRLCLFGRIGKGEMKINDAGNIVLYWWGEMQNKYRNIELHERVIMPNHFHGIIEIKSGSEFVGANLRVRPNESRPNLESDKGQTHRSAPTEFTHQSSLVTKHFPLYNSPLKMIKATHGYIPFKHGSL